MKQEIYLDVYLLTNLLMNYAMLSATALLVFHHLRPLRVLAGGLLGTAYAMLPLVFPLPKVPGVVLWFLVLLTMCRLSFGKNSAKVLLGCAIFTLVFSVTAGGILQSLQNHGVTLEGKLGLSLLSGVGIATVTVVRCLAEKGEEKLKITKARLEFCFRGNRWDLSAFCDSGNLLKEPISGFPVILLANSHAEDSRLSDYYNGKTEQLDNLYVIPVQSAVGSQLLYGFRPEEITVSYHGKSKTTNRVIIAANPGCESFCDCSCLLPNSLI